MAIGGVNFNSGSYDYLSASNQIKMQQTLFKNRSSNTLSKLKSYQHNTDTASSSLSGSTSFINKYSRSMSDLMSAANKLRTANESNVMNNVSAESSNEDVLTASKTFSFSKLSNDYTVDVQQVAKSQVNQSDAVNAADTAANDLQLTVRTSQGNISYSANKLTEDGQAKTNKQVYEDLAKSINDDNDSSVRASVVKKDGQVSLQLTSRTTGQANAFIADGNVAGMDNVTQVSQDAVYTVSKNGEPAEAHTSTTNRIYLEDGEVSVTLKGEGKADIKPQMDNKKVVSAVSDLVDNFNSTLKLLNDNAERGEGVTRQLSNMLHGPAAEKSLELIGITFNKDGTLSLDKDKLTKSLQDDPSLTKNIIGGSVGLAQGAFEDARSGLNTSSDSLLSNDLKQVKTDYSADTLQMMNMFSRRGAFNMSNYSTVGMMMNMLI